MSVKNERIRIYAWLGLLAVTCVAADGGDDWSDNLFSGLSPLVELFGERATIQFMSESMGWADNIILAMAPIGIITIITCAIRVGGSTWLRATIGRTRETFEDAEVELMTSTSEKVCEFWDGQKLKRCISSNPVLELICLLPKEKERILRIETTTWEEVFHESGRTCQELDRCGVCRSEQKSDVESGNASAPSSLEALGELNSQQRLSITRNLEPGPPNLFLNIYGGSMILHELVFAAVCGTVLQLGVLVYAGFATYYPSLMFPKDDKPVASYAYPCTTAGTLLLVFGIAVCAHVVNSTTKEREFKAKDGRKIRAVWLQQQRTVSDQSFKSCAIYANTPQLSIKTSRRDKRPEHENQTLFGTAVTLSGFVLQFVGLRGMHWSTSIAQLGAVLVMVLFKAWVRRRSAVRPKIQELVSGFELDWLARTLGNDAYASFWHWGGQDQKNGCLHDWIIQSDKGTNLKAETASNDDRRSCAQEILDTRKKLGEIAQWQGFAHDEALSLSRAIEVTMDTLFKNTRGADWKWQLPIQCDGDDQVELQLLSKENGWRVDTNVIDAALSLWLSSTNTECSRTMAPTGLPAENKTHDPHYTADKLPKNENSNRLRPNDSSMIQGKRSLGEYTPQVERDLAWWVPWDLLRASKLNEDDPKLLQIDNPKNSSHHAQDKPADSARSANRVELLAIDFNASQKLLYAQSLFSLFMQAVAKKLSEPVKGGANELLPESTAGGGDWKKFQLRNNTLSRMVQDVHQTGLGSLTEIYTSIITPLSQEKKLPGIDKVVEWVREHAEKFARLEDWKRTGECLKWLSTVAETPYTTARAEGILMDHLRRAVSVKKFHEEQDLPADRPLLQSILEAKMETKRRRRQELINSNIGDIGELFSFNFGVPTSRLFDTFGDFDPHLRPVHRDAVKFPDAFKITNLHYQALRDVHGYQEISQSSSEDRVNAKDILDRTPAHYCVGSGGVYIRKLKKHGADLNAQDLLGWTPLHYACQAGFELVIEELIQAGVGPDHQARDGATPLHCAVSSGSLKGVRQLVEAGATVDVQDFQGNLPIHLAAYRGHDDIVDVLLKGGSRNLRDRFGRTAPHQAALAGKKNVIDVLLANDVFAKDLEARDRNGQTSLSLAARANHPDCIEALLKKGADVDLKDREGQTPLHWAAKSGHPDCIKALLDKGADINSQNHLEETPLYCAAESGHTECVGILLNKLADANLPNHWGGIPLHAAAQSGNLKTVQLLEKCSGVDPQAHQTGWTPLMLAAWYGRTDIIEHLIENGANHQRKDVRNRTALHHAIRQDAPEPIETLIRRGANIETTGEDGLTPLISAIDSSNPRAVNLLLENGAKIEATDTKGRTPLMVAAEEGNLDAIEQLLARSANIEATNADGKTALMFAAEKGNINAVKQLLARGANIETTDTDGGTALSVAGDEEVRVLLQSFGKERPPPQIVVDEPRLPGGAVAM